MKPHFKHDCTHCQFLATIDLAVGRFQGFYDLYFCDTSGYVTVIARYSDSPQDNYSGLGFKQIVPLLVAETIAKNQGLLK